MVSQKCRPNNQDADQPYDQFILFGDSLTEMSSNQDRGYGFQAALQDAYSRRLDIINRGFSGYTTAHAVKVLPKFFPTPQKATVRFLAILFGCNVACLPGNYQHVPLNVFKDNLRQIIQHPVIKSQNPRVFVLTPPPVNEYQLEAFDASESVPHPSRTATHTKMYADATRQVATSLRVPVADLWTAFMTAAGWKEGQALIGSREVPDNETFHRLFTDGLHLTADGYRLEYDVVMETIRKSWGIRSQRSYLWFMMDGV